MDPVIALPLARLGIGAAALAAPETAAKLFRLDAEANPQLPYLLRMFGSREIALGALTIGARGRARTVMVATGVAVDAGDAWAGQLAGRSGAVSRRTSQFLTAPALTAVLAGLFAVLRRPR